LYLFSGLGFTLMLLDFHRSPTIDPPPLAGPWRKRVVDTLGLASYPTYLFHGPILMLAGSLILRYRLVADWRITWALLFVLGTVSGTALGWLLERPVMSWRANLLRSLRARRGFHAPGAAPARVSTGRGLPVGAASASR